MFAPSNASLLFPGVPVGSEAPPGGWETWIDGSTPAPFIRGPGTLPPFAVLPGTLATNSLQFFFSDGYLRYFVFDDPTFDLRNYRFDTVTAQEQAALDLLVPAETDLSSFRDRSGKLLMYHGWADPALTAFESVSYYREVFKTLAFVRGEGAREAHGRERTTDFFRLFMVPGMYHCEGGPGTDVFDTLTPLEQWVEHGIAPARIVAAHLTAGVVDRTRPLCPYPRVARHLGSGSTDEAASFECVTPRRLGFLDALIAAELRREAGRDDD